MMRTIQADRCKSYLWPIAALLAGGCQPTSESFLDISSAERRAPGHGASRPTSLGDSAGGDADLPAASAEVCDGWDNDRDGEVDEGTDGVACSTSAETQGTSRCVNGRMICEECHPGQTRQADCGCGGIVRTDLCNDAGRWLTGACDGCAQSLDSTSCGFCGFRAENGQCIDAGECHIGEVMYVRCDNCPAGDPSCGTSCYGEKWVCAGNCRWQKAESCAARSAECNRDEVHYQECGMCGYQKVECDGCFWTPGTCQDEGICVPGSGALVPCFAGACADGLVSSISCNEQCEWVTQESCSGCIPGPPTQATYACMPGYDCGEYTVQSQCVASERSTCQGQQTITVGQEQSWTVASSCNISCTPGQSSTRGCRTAAGECGTEPTLCAGDCQWGEAATGPCTTLPTACVPGTQTVTSEVRDCGYCGETNKYTVTTTCTCAGSGCGTFCSTTYAGSCPPCAPGMHSGVSCTDDQGCGGSAPVVCTDQCQWGPPGECVNARTCTPSSNTFGCPDGCHTYTVTTSCDSCGGATTTSDYQTQCQAACTLGATRTTPCGHCGQVRTDTCNNTCSAWVEGVCPPDTCG